jgi:hypothetical protein
MMLHQVQRLYNVKCDEMIIRYCVVERSEVEVKWSGHAQISVYDPNICLKGLR